MGGLGSGRGWQGGKKTTDYFPALDVRRLHRDGLLTPRQVWSTTWLRNGKELASIQMESEVDRVILNYQSRNRINGGDSQHMQYPVYLEWTNCHLGGRRPWFLCPKDGCGRRVAIIYGGTVFACRHCHKLVYDSQRQTNGDQLLRRTEKIQRRLGWDVGILSRPGEKPKGMHWRTFKRLKAEHEVSVLVSKPVMQQQLALMNKRLVCLGIDGLSIDI